MRATVCCVRLSMVMCSWGGDIFLFMKKLVFFLCLFVPCVSWAVTRPHTGPDTLAMSVPDMSAVRLAVQDRTSPYYYPVLMDRYLRRDTTLTADDYRYLYLGYSFQEDYNPYRVSFYNTAIDTLYNRCSHTPEECKELVRYAHRILADNPFDLRRMAVLVYANNLLDNESEVLFWHARIHHLVDAIISTGDGCTPETAWYIIEPVHAYDLLNTLGVIAESYDFCPPCYDYIQVYDLIGNARGFYFNVSRILEEYQRKYVYE